MAHGFYQKHFLDFHNFPKFFENFEIIMRTCIFIVAKKLNPSGRMVLSCSMISQSNCEKAGQDECSYNNMKYQALVFLHIDIRSSVKYFMVQPLHTVNK